jgi:hypothetical protein
LPRLGCKNGKTNQIKWLLTSFDKNRLKISASPEIFILAMKKQFLTVGITTYCCEGVRDPQQSVFFG